MYILKWFRFTIAKIYNILRYVIARILRHMCNFAYQRNWNISKTKQGNQKLKDITYSVILSVLTNKTNLILGFIFKGVCCMLSNATLNIILLGRWHENGLKKREKRSALASWRRVDFPRIHCEDLPWTTLWSTSRYY